MRNLLILALFSLIYPTSAAGQTVYADNFRQKPKPVWHSVAEPGMFRPLKWIGKNHYWPVWASKTVSDTHNGMIRSSGPWWTDPNHVAPGIGWLQIIAFSYWAGYLDRIPTRKLDNWEGDEIPKSAFSIGTPERPIDLSGVTINLRVRGEIRNAPAGSWLGFYFSADSVDAIENRPVRVHYTNVANPIKLHPKKWTNVKFVLRPYDSDWVCMGQKVQARSQYGCARSVLDVIDKVNVNVGFLLFNGYAKPIRPVDGYVEFDRIKIMRYEQAN
jgi:hypothetical protein